MGKIVPQLVRRAPGVPHGRSFQAPALMNTLLLFLGLKGQKKVTESLKAPGGFVKFCLGRLAVPRFSSLSGCLDV